MMATILVVDDSETERQYLTKLLQAKDFNVVVANNAEDGVDAVRNIKPDVVLMDVVMPGMNGFQATRLLTKDAQTSNIPVIVISTKDQETDRIWAERQGARDYLVKPVRKEDLYQALVKILG